MKQPRIVLAWHPSLERPLMTDFFSVSTEVREALAAGQPVVALESTIFTHGLPRPRNLEVALEGEAVIRAAGALPATIGVFRGVPTVGLSAAQIEEMANDDSLIKAATRELAYASVTGVSAGTTIAATAFLARAAGIDVFSTGGLGGVHHGAETSFDESADLAGMANTSIVLVSSGAKAILDIAKTLERFESLGVPVIGYRTNRYPGFYVADSGYAVSARLDSPQQIAQMLRRHRGLGAASGLLIANPIPAADSLDSEELDIIIQRAWHDLERDGVSGQRATPYLLDYIRRATDGRSLDANVALYLNNIRLAVQIAKSLVDAQG